VNKGLQPSNYFPILLGKAATEFSKERGQWLLANVDQQIGWPLKKVVVIYRGRKVLLLPATRSAHAAAAILTKGHTLNGLKEGKTFLMQFLSALAWYHPAKLEIVEWTNASTQGALTKYLRLPLSKSAGMGHQFFRPTELPDPIDSQAQLALALFREGLSINHLGYSFLSFYKIINLRYHKEERQKKWLKRSLSLIENLHHLKEIFKKIKSQHSDPVQYIYEACRCAVAHASMEKITYNPESIEDAIRFYEIHPIMIALAKVMIENEFGIKSTNTILGEHLYELEGFHQLLGGKISKSLKTRETLALSDISLNTKISLRIWNKRKFKAFENLHVTVIAVNKGVVTLSLSRDNLIKFQMVLDFPNEKLIFDPTQSINFNDDGTKNAALQLSNAYQFYSEFMGNPVLEVWETKPNIILGRLLEYLPTVRQGQPMPHVVKERCLIKMKEWKQKAKERSPKTKVGKKLCHD
jgi:hypothetical protein